MLPNQRNIETVAVGNTTTELKLVLDADGTTPYVLATHKKAPVRIVRGAPGDVGYWSSDTIKWSSSLNLGPVASYAAAALDKWTIANINTVVDGSNPARELNLRVWPVGLSSIEWQRLINTGHFYQLHATQSAIKVATEFASILDANYKNQREHGSGGLRAYVTTSGVGATAVTGATQAFFVENTKAVLILGAGMDIGELEPGGVLIDEENGISYGIASVSGSATAINIVLTSSVVMTTGTPTAPKVITKAVVDDTSAIEAASIVIEATANKWELGQYNWEATRLQLTTAGMGPATYSAMASEGNGNYQQVADREWFSKGNEGKPMRLNAMAPVKQPYLHTLSTVNYVTYSLQFTHDMLEPLGQPNNSPKSIYIAEATGATALHGLLEDFVLQA